MPSSSETEKFFASTAASSVWTAGPWAANQRELKRRGVTLALLWQEYIAEHPTGYSYTHFCDLHRAWKKTVSAVPDT